MSKATYSLDFQSVFVHTSKPFAAVSVRMEFLLHFQVGK